MTVETVRGGRGGFIGPVGGLVELPVVSAQQVSFDRQVTFKTTLGGGRRAFAGASDLRSWQVTLPGQRTPELSNVLTLLRSSPGPFVWLSPFAQVTNMLPRDMVEFRSPHSTVYATDLSGGGLAVPQRGVGAKTAGSQVCVADSFPVVPGLVTTFGVSVWGADSSTALDVYYQRADGVYVSESAATTALDGSTLHATGRVPAEAATAQMWLSGKFTYASRPTVTLTDHWSGPSVGHGCAACVVTDVNLDVVATHGFRGGVRTARGSMKITEVA